MKKIYISPILICQSFESEVTAAGSFKRNRGSGCYGPKNGNYGNNKNCWGTKEAMYDINEYGDYCNA